MSRLLPGAVVWISALAACGEVVPIQVDATAACVASECADTDLCTVDTCEASGCQHTPITCEDNDACTVNSCASGTGCVYTRMTGMQTFSYTGAIETFTVPACATMLHVTAQGAQGGNSNGTLGGMGASITGEFAAMPGEVISILVGGMGIDAQANAAQRSGSGGGGTFVVRGAAILAIAGGGGGAYGEGAGFMYGTAPGGPGQITVNGQNGGPPDSLAGGIAGGGGLTNPNGGYPGGTGGGGYAGDGVNNSTGNPPSTPGKAYVNGGQGGVGGAVGARNGGFGGGGAAGFVGGGGGGYSGGGAGANLGVGMTATHSGGGGGSINNGTSPMNVPGVRTGNGEVVISW